MKKNEMGVFSFTVIRALFLIYIPKVAELSDLQYRRLNITDLLALFESRILHQHQFNWNVQLTLRSDDGSEMPVHLQFDHFGLPMYGGLDTVKDGKIHADTRRPFFEALTNLYGRGVNWRLENLEGLWDGASNQFKLTQGAKFKKNYIIHPLVSMQQLILTAGESDKKTITSPLLSSPIDVEGTRCYCQFRLAEGKIKKEVKSTIREEAELPALPSLKLN